MTPDNTSAMIALLPITTDWCKIDLPHLTLVYAGETKDLNNTDFNALAKDAASLAIISRPITLEVLGTEIFGDEEKVDVFKLRPTSELLAMRHSVERWNASKFPFRPHVTIGPAGSFSGNIPSLIAFDRIIVAWNDDVLTFLIRQF